MSKHGTSQSRSSNAQVLIDHSLTLNQLLAPIGANFVFLDQYLQDDMQVSEKQEEVAPALISIQRLWLNEPRDVVDLIERVGEENQISLRSPTPRETLSILAASPRMLDEMSIHAIGHQEPGLHLWAYRDHKGRSLFSYFWGNGPCGYGENNPYILVVMK